MDSKNHILTTDVKKYFNEGEFEKLPVDVQLEFTRRLKEIEHQHSKKACDTCRIKHLCRLQEAATTSELRHKLANECKRYVS